MTETSVMIELIYKFSGINRDVKKLVPFLEYYSRYRTEQTEQLRIIYSHFIYAAFICAFTLIPI